MRLTIRDYSGRQDGRGHDASVRIKPEAGTEEGTARFPWRQERDYAVDLVTSATGRELGIIWGSPRANPDDGPALQRDPRATAPVPWPTSR
jgi:hypothetical protein